MRYVRAATQNGDGLEPKSRFISPAPLIPHIGTYRIDAPTTFWVAMQVAATISVSLKMSRVTIDVCPACLSEMLIGRSIHIRAPSCGPPSVV